MYEPVSKFSKKRTREIRELRIIIIFTFTVVIEAASSNKLYTVLFVQKHFDTKTGF